MKENVDEDDLYDAVKACVTPLNWDIAGPTLSLSDEKHLYTITVEELKYSGQVEINFSADDLL